MANTEFAAAKLTMGQLNAIVKKLGGYEGAIRFLQGETLVTEAEKKWREQDGIIYFSVTSDGTTGEEWFHRLKKNELKVHEDVLELLCSKDFKTSSGVMTEIAILKGRRDETNGLILKEIRAEASKLGFSAPNAEVACLIRENFSNDNIKAMGFDWIVTMHEPIKDCFGNPRLLIASRRSIYYRDNGGLCTNFGTTYDDRDGECFARGFAFMRSIPSYKSGLFLA